MRMEIGMKAGDSQFNPMHPAVSLRISLSFPAQPTCSCQPATRAKRNFWPVLTLPRLQTRPKEGKVSHIGLYSLVRLGQKREG